MSTPISYCIVSRAARGDENAFNLLLKTEISNLGSPAHTIFGCGCKPSCPEPTPEQFQKLQKRIQTALKEYAETHKL